MTRVQVLKRGQYEASALAPLPRETLPTVRVVPKTKVDAALEAQRLLSDAERKAQERLDEAQRKASDLLIRAETEGRANGAAALAAQAIRLKLAEQRAGEAQLDQLVSLARLLAERLLGEELSLDPSKVSALASQAIREARGARRIQVVCHPDDQLHLETMLEQVEATSAVELVRDPNRPRGNVKLITDVGVLDAAIAPQLERLALRLRQELKT